MSSELACTYAALILNDDGIDITADKLTAILKAAKVDVEPFWPGLFAGALKDVDVTSLISNIGSGAGAAAPAGGAAAAGGGAAEDAPKEEAKKEESSEESDDDMGFGLFD
jgi:large subunit ribosomal protein LP1